MKSKPTTVVRIEGGFVLLRVSPHFEYDIPMSYLRDERGFQFWAEHLSAKSWMTAQHRKQFVKLVRPMWKERNAE